MSHVTRCPACNTHFRVVNDQLKIAEGWVRCGQCGEVFDANLSMQPWPPQADASPPVVAPETEPASIAPGLAESAPMTEPPASVEQAEPLAEQETDSGHTLGPLPEPPPEAEAEAEARVAPSPVPEPEVAFVRQARRRATWSRPWVRGLMWVTAVALAMLLVLQILVHQRDRLAAAYPAVTPALQALCEPLGCTIEPYRQIESVQIDSSALVREREDLYRLEVGLKNVSALALAMPALELSLTNAADDVVLRRVLQPGEWDNPAPSLPAHGTVLLSVRLSLQDAGDLRMAGYRALVFYP